MFYVVHEYLALPSGRSFKVGDVLRGADAAEFARACVADPSLANKATRTSVNPNA